jgi:Protein involved in formate dehydrogenase formation
VPPQHPDALWRLATAQWAEITRNSPDLAPAVALQQRLLRLMLDASTALEEVAEAPLTSESICEKWSRGLPAWRNETIAIPPGLKEILLPICTALAECGAGESALRIRDAIATQGIDADSLLSVSLARNQKAIRTSALHMGFSPDLVWLIGEIGSAPLAHHLSSIVHRRSTGIEKGSGSLFPESHAKKAPGAFFACDLWDHGYCPCCGSWPAFIEADDATHTLRCSYCALGWSVGSHRCVYCGNAGDDFIAAAPDVTHPQRRVELCGKCSGYTKVIDARDPTPFPLLAIADLATIELDQGAMDRGYRRPELFDLDAIEPRTTGC